jgi:hypothetical protein
LPFLNGNLVHNYSAFDFTVGKGAEKTLQL